MKKIMTLQESIDFAVEAIVKQGGRCMANESVCAYGQGDRHCYIGQLLDHDNADLMESGDGVHALCANYKSAVPNVIRENLHLFTTLQRFHDSVTQSGRQSALDSVICLIKDDSKLMINFNNPAFMVWVGMGE